MVSKIQKQLVIIHLTNKPVDGRYKNINDEIFFKTQLFYINCVTSGQEHLKF